MRKIWQEYLQRTLDLTQLPGGNWSEQKLAFAKERINELLAPDIVVDWIVHDGTQLQFQISPGVLMARNIAFFVGAETGGLEEARSSGTGHSASTANASMLGKDSYHYRITGNGGINMRFQLFADGRPADQGDGYLFSFDIEWTALPSAQAEFFHIYEDGVSTQACCELQHNADNSLSLA